MLNGVETKVIIRGAIDPYLLLKVYTTGRLKSGTHDTRTTLFAWTPEKQ